MSDLATRRMMELSGSMTMKALTSLGPLPLSGLHGPPAIVVAPTNSGANAAIARPPAAERLAWMKARRERAIVIGIGLKSWRVRRRDARRCPVTHLPVSQFLGPLHQTRSRTLWAQGRANRSLARRPFRRHNRHFRVDVGEGGIHLRAIELPLPDRNHNGRHAIADDVGQRSDLAHELVDSKNDRKPWHEPRVGGGEGSSESDEAGAGDAARPFRGQHRDEQDGQQLAPAEIDVQRLRDE